MVDVHSHVLPALDDGVRTLEESLIVLRVLHQFGFTHVVATPHHYRGRYVPSVEQIDLALTQVRAALEAEGIPLTLIRGRECLLDYELLTAVDRDAFPFVVDGKKYQLIELPQMTLPAAASTYLRHLQTLNIQPILAHAERYNRIIRDPGAIRDYLDMGFMIQVDVRSFSRKAHKLLRETANRLLKERAIRLLASDVHHPDQLEEIGDALTWLRKELKENEFERYFTLD